jgi:NAD(P)-dependent dehydrogenase (short-subunit alcohol dehydrogenase family)
MDLKDTAAIVTGGASGLGEATARSLASGGAKVAIFDVNKTAADAVAADIGGIGVACDVTSADAAEAAVATARKAHGAARVLVNCAGIGPPGRAVSRRGPLPLDDFRKIIEINLIGTFNCIRLAAADMLALDPLQPDGERGVIISTSSVAAYDGQIGQPAYAASKGGIASMTLPLAREFASSGVRVMTIAPGLFATPLMFSLPEEAQKALGASVPFPSRLGHVDEYAALVRHICANPMLNGEVIRLDGALRMAPR